MNPSQFLNLLEIMPRIGEVVNCFPQHLQETVYKTLMGNITLDNAPITLASDDEHSSRAGAVRSMSPNPYPVDKTPDWEARTARNTVAPKPGDGDGK